MRPWNCADCGAADWADTRFGPTPLRCGACAKARAKMRRDRKAAQVTNARVKRRATLAAQWVRLNRPDVWAAIVAESARWRPKPPPAGER